MSRWLQANYKRKAKVQTMEELIKVVNDELKASGDTEPFTETEFWDADKSQKVDDLINYDVDINSELFKEIASDILTDTDYPTVQYLVQETDFVKSKYFEELFKVALKDHFLSEVLFEEGLISKDSPYYIPAKETLLEAIQFDPELGKNLVKKGILDESEINN